jgi:hypothetical protein
MRAAHALATACLPQYGDRFSRHDFTLPQLFACLVVREHSGRATAAPRPCSATARNGWPTSG